MNEVYFVGILLTGGVCLGFAIHAITLAFQSRQTAYARLAMLALLGTAYCITSYGYFRELRPDAALAWGRGICVFTPFITWVFTELVTDLTGYCPPWLRNLQRVNFILALAFSAMVVLDGSMGTTLALKGFVQTDLASRHRHRLFFAPVGTVWLAWVSVMFTLCAVLLVKGRRTRLYLTPMVVGCLLYFLTTISDFGILTGLYDTYFVQHLGFFALVVGCWRVLSGRYEKSLDELRSAVKRLEKQHKKLLISAPIAQQHKLDAIGTLAAGVAHEINNPIQGIMNYGQLLQRHLDEGETHQFAVEIVTECRRVADIVNALLQFARADDRQLGAITVEELMSDVIKLTRGTLDDDGIRLEMDVPIDLPALNARVQQMKQVLMNLLTNARDALRERDPQRRDQKKIVFRARAIERHAERWLLLEAIDNGDGIDPGILEKIFDPFFTTKAQGQGTGLGLSICQGIVSTHGGSITCSSVRGEGTRFCVELPVDGSIRLSSTHAKIVGFRDPF